MSVTIGRSPLHRHAPDPFAAAEQRRRARAREALERPVRQTARVAPPSKPWAPLLPPDPLAAAIAEQRARAAALQAPRLPEPPPPMPAPLAVYYNTTPNFYTGQIPSADEWNSYFGEKVDAQGGTLIAPSLTQAVVSLAHDPMQPMDAVTLEYLQSSTIPGDAPQDGNTYGRMNAKWSQVLPLSGGTLTGGLQITSVTPGTPQLYLNSSGTNWATLFLNTNPPDITASPNAANYIRGMKNGLNRWTILMPDTQGETGGNVGSDFRIYRNDDSGNQITDPSAPAGQSLVQVVRATGEFQYWGPQLTLWQPQANVANAAVRKDYVDNGFLPLTGGTLSGMLNLDVALTGTAYVSAETIQSTATGSGTNGPSTAQVGLTITHEKVGYTNFTAGVGEIDGIYAHVHQSGTGNDSSVILGDLTHNGQGFASFTECNVNIMQPGTWNLLGSIHNTEAAMDNNGTFEGYGHTYTVLAGSMTTAILVQNQTGATWNNVLQNQKNGAITYNIDDAGNVTQTGNVHIGVGSVAGTSRNLQFQTGTGLRWQIEASSDAESGGNNGSNFYLSAFDDSGGFLSQPFRIYRSSGLVSVQNGLYIAGGSLTVTGTATGQTMPAGDQSTNFATTAFVANAVAGGIPEAPHDGTAYGRENATWINVLPLTGGTLSGQLTVQGTTTVDNLIVSPNYSLLLTAAGQGTDQNIWSMAAQAGGTLAGYAVNDAENAATQWLSVTRSGYVPTAINLNAPTHVSGADNVGGFTYAHLTIDGGGTVTNRGVVVAQNGVPNMFFGSDGNGQFTVQNFTGGNYTGELLTLNMSGLLTLYNGGIDFGSRMAASPTDLTQHIDLYHGWGGFSITSGALNIVTGGNVAAGISGGQWLIGVGYAFTLAQDPINAMDAATKHYVDQKIASGGTFVDAPSDGNLYARLNGGWSSGGTLTATLNAPQFIGTSGNGGTNAAFLARSAGNSTFAWDSTSAGADQGKWDALAAGNTLYFRALSDNEGTANTWLSVSRSGAVPQTIALGASATINGNLDVVGVTASGTLQAQTSYINGQGAYLWWNHGNGDGGTWIANQKGGGAGGINFVETDTAANVTATYLTLGPSSANLKEPLTINAYGGVWSGANIGQQLLIEGVQNNAIGISDSSGGNFVAMANNAGTIWLAGMPLLSDSSTGPDYRLSLSSTLISINKHAAFGSGLDCGNLVGSSAQDMSNHVCLWGQNTAGSYGFNVTSNTLNYNAGSAGTGTHSFYSGGNLLVSIGASALNTNIPITLPADPTTALQAATKQYVDAHTGGAATTFNGYTTAGTFTWAKPAGCSKVTIVCYGAGGAGGGGQGSSSTFARSGGSGGGGGARTTITMAAADLPATVTVTVGAGGVSAAGGNNAAGTSGAAGGTSSFGTILVAYGGGGGFAGSGSNSSGGGGGGSAGAGGAGAGSSAFGGSPAAPFGGAGSTNGGGGSAAEFGGASGGGQAVGTPAAFGGGGSLFAGSGGGAGGSLTTGNAGSAGGAGGAVKTWTNGTQGGGGATGTTGAPGSAGTAGSSGFGGGGGAGGGAATGGTGGTGGPGGAPGGGGGGGGAGTTTGGASGAGGAGAVYVWAS